MPETWEPTLAVLSSRAIPENLIGFITNEAWQEAVLTWAGGSGLKLLQTRAQRRKHPDKPAFPVIYFSDDNDAKQYDSEVVPGAYSLVLEVVIQNADPDEATRQARIYAKAIESMILNIPKATLLDGTGAFAATLDTIETGFDRMKENKDRKNDFYQIFQVRAVWQLQMGYRS